MKLNGDVIEAATFEARACAAVVAVASLMSTRMVGLTLEDAKRISILELDQELGGLPPSKRHAYLMLLEAFLDCEKYFSQGDKEYG